MATRMSKKNVRAMLRAAGAQVQAENRNAERSKYGAIRTVVDGIAFASKKEAKRYGELKMMESQGKVHRLTLQPRFPLVVKDRKIGVYVADFSYWVHAGHGMEQRIEDVKGYRTREYKFKKALAEVLHGITVIES